MQRNARSHYLPGSRARQVFEAARDGNAVKLGNVLKQMKSHEITEALEAKTTSSSSLMGDAGEATPLIAAAENGHLNCVKMLLKHKANMTSRGLIFYRNGMQRASLLSWRRSRCTTPLAVAAAYGHVDLLRYLVENGCDVNARMDSNLTALMLASENCHVNVVKYLIEHGANMELQDEDSNTALHYAVCHEGDSCDVLKCLLEKGAAVNEQTCLDCTPLMLASENDHMNLVTCLIENGADVHIQDGSGETALHYAVHYHRESCGVVRCLLTNGADVNASANGLYTPLMLACRTNSINLVTCLIEHGANIDFQDGEGDTTLHYAVCGILCGNFVNNMSEVAHKLLALGASQLYNNQRMTPLLLACNRCKISAVEVLIKRPECTKEQRIDALELLGASIATSPFDEFHIPEDGFEYMKRAMEERFQDPSNRLLKQTMEPEEDYQNQKESETLEELARIEGNTNAIIMEGLIIRERILGTDNTALLTFVGNVADHYNAGGDFPICIGLYSHKIKITQSCNESATFDLHRLTSLLYKNLKLWSNVSTQKVLGELLEQTIFEYDKEQKSTTRSTDLRVLLDSLMKLVQIAEFKYCEESKTSRISLLLQKLFHLNPRGDCGETLLHKAVEYLSTSKLLSADTVKLLLSAGLNVNAIDNNGDTPLHRAATFKPSNGDEFNLLSDMLEVLLNGGAHHDFINNDGKTAMDMAQTDVARTVFSAEKRRKLELKCISARAVKKFGLPYVGVVPKTLEKYISMH